MKRTQFIFTLLLIPIDYLTLALSSILAYKLRTSDFVTNTYPVDYIIDYEKYLETTLTITPIWLIIFALVGLYNIKANRKLSAELNRIFIGVSFSLLAMVFAIFLQRELFSSRFIILMAWIISIVLVFLGRMLALGIQRKFFKYGIGTINLLVIGSGPESSAIIAEINDRPSHGFKIIKNYDSFSNIIQEKIKNLTKSHIIDEIVIADPKTDKNTILNILDYTEENHLGFRYAADLFNTVTRNTSIEPIAGIPIIELKKTSLDGWGKIAKRIFDIITSSVFIIILSPIIILTAIAVKITSTGPIIFKNERVGQKGKLFDTYKFRSFLYEYNIGKQFPNSKQALDFEKELITKQNTRTGPLYKISNDPRLTPIGGFIRRWSLDELPQLFNVFFGSMSLVGPRPHLPREVAQYEKHHKRLLTIKPGITGMAQVSGRSDLSFEEEAKLDIFYIEHWNILIDIIILIKTPFAILKSRKAK